MDVPCVDVPCSESPVDIQKKGMEVSMNKSDNLKCMQSPVMPSKCCGMRKKRICYQYWNTFGRCKSGDSCPYDHVCVNAFKCRQTKTGTEKDMGTFLSNSS